MMKRLFFLFAVITASGLIAVGCGDDDDDGGNGGSDAADTTVEETTSVEVPEGAPEEVDAAVQQAIEACKQSVNAAPQLSADVKSDLEGICDEAASGDIQAVQEASREVCTKIVEETVPAGPAQEQALSACEATAP